MFNRLFFLIPNKMYARRIIDELADTGFNLKNIHALEKNEVEKQTSSRTSPWKRLDLTEQIETVLWSSNLVIFMLATATLLVSLFMGLTLWLIIALVVMLATFVLGDLFSLYVPRVHLNEFEHALSHGEVLLIIDVPRKQTPRIEEMILRHHPAAIAGGTSWTLHLPTG